MVYMKPNTLDPSGSRIVLGSPWHGPCFFGRTMMIFHYVLMGFRLYTTYGRQRNPSLRPPLLRAAAVLTDQ